MPEIITLSVGGAGNSIGSCFWKLISFEHGIDYSCGEVEQNCCCLQRSRMDVYFNQCQGQNRWYAREIIIDTDPITSRPDGSFLYKYDNAIKGRASAANNFACGYLTEGREIIANAVEAIRKEAESCQSLQGFQILHSIGGGTGSGLNALIMRALSEEYTECLISNYTILPSPKITDAVVEPYNALLGLQHLTDDSHLTFCLDNEALKKIAMRNLKTNGTVESLNNLIALTISGITASLRFPGQLNSGLRKIYVNMVPFPQLHYMITGFSPALLCRDRMYMEGTPLELVKAMFSNNNLLCYVDLREGKFLTAAGLIRGLVSTGSFEEICSLIKSQNRELFVNWIPNNIKLGFCDIPPRGFKTSGTLIGNNSSITNILQRVYDQAQVLLSKRAHLHWYLNEGLEEQEFQEAMEALKSLISSYNHAKEG